MQRLGEEVLTHTAHHVVEAVATLGTDLTVTLPQDFVDQVLLVRCQVQFRIHRLQTSEAYAAAHHVQVVQRPLQVTRLGTRLGTDQIHLCQTDIGHTDILVVIAAAAVVVQQPLELTVARCNVIRIGEVAVVLHETAFPGVGVRLAGIVKAGRQRLTGHEDGLIQARVAVCEHIVPVGILARAVDVRIGEVAAVLHAEALHQLVRRHRAALSVAVQCKAAPAPAPAAVRERQRRVRVKQLLVVRRVVAVAVGAAVGRAVARLVLSRRLYQRVVVAVLRVVLEELVAILQAAAPQ